MSLLNSQDRTTTTPDRGQPQLTNRTGLVVNNGDATRQHPDQTEGMRAGDSAPGNGHPKNPIQQNPGNESQQNNQSGPQEPHSTWYSRLAEKYGSLELENKGSVARDHLALERTFLAWLRTSLAFASVGIAVTQLFRLNAGSTQTTEITSQAFPPLLSPPFYDPAQLGVTSASQRLRNVGKPLGTTFIGIAILILLIGFHRYFESQHWILQGKFAASRGSIALISLVAGALIVTSLVVILAVSPGAVET